MIACRTLHDLSSASSTMAGKRWSASSWIPMTGEMNQSSPCTRYRGEHTLIHLFEFTDDVQPNIGEFVLQQVQEELEKVIDGGSVTKERCKPSYLICKSGPDMLGTVLTEIPNKGYYAGNHNLWFQ